jgi:predicted kinase
MSMSNDDNSGRHSRLVHGTVFIQMFGAPGSGKSMLAKLLREPCEAVVIDDDMIKSTLLADDKIWFDQAAKAAYNVG